MKLKKLTSIIIATVMIFGLVACSGNASQGDNQNSDNNSDKKITIWAWDESFNIVAANKAKEIYLKDNPEAEVEVVTMAQDDIVVKLNTSYKFNKGLCR